MQKPLFVVVSGGVIQNTRVEVIDFDKLLPDTAEVGDTVRAWRALSGAAKLYVLKMYADEYDRIHKRMDAEEQSIRWG